MQIVWTKHAKVRQQEWEKKKGLTRKEVETVLSNPQQIVQGDLNVLVAQTKARGGLLRVLYVEIGPVRKILTV